MREKQMSDTQVTILLKAVNSGNGEAYDALLGILYNELRNLAGAIMRKEHGYRTLQPTALVHEAFLRLAQGESRWENRAHFFGAAARAMRRVLVEYARQKASQKRGGDAQRVTFMDIDVQTEDPQVELLALDQAVAALAEVDPRLVKVVELRYFAGCSLEETASLLGVAQATVKRDWAYARAWLYEYMNR
jgi:RNA polymerase sigma-70 factor (ECF subfamily)